MEEVDEDEVGEHDHDVHIEEELVLCFECSCVETDYFGLLGEFELFEFATFGVAADDLQPSLEIKHRLACFNSLYIRKEVAHQ